MTATLALSCDVCGESRCSDVALYLPLSAAVTVKPPRGWESDGDGQLYCAKAACREAWRRVMGDEPERQPDTKDSL